MKEDATDGTAPLRFFPIKVLDGRPFCEQTKVRNTAGGKEHGRGQRGLPSASTGEDAHIYERLSDLFVL